MVKKEWEIFIVWKVNRIGKKATLKLDFYVSYLVQRPNVSCLVLDSIKARVYLVIRLYLVIHVYLIVKIYLVIHVYLIVRIYLIIRVYLVIRVYLIIRIYLIVKSIFGR